MILVRVICVFATVLCLCTPAFSQDIPNVEVSAGYSLLHDNIMKKSAHGWVASLTGNVRPWFGLTGEIGGSAANNAGFGETQLGMHSFMAGPRLTATIGRHLSPFGHFLVGITRSSTWNQGFAAVDNDFAIQPGAGVNVWLRPGFGIRVGADYRRLPPQEFGGSHGFRFQIGFVANVSE